MRVGKAGEGIMRAASSRAAQTKPAHPDAQPAGQTARERCGLGLALALATLGAFSPVAATAQNVGLPLAGPAAEALTLADARTVPPELLGRAAVPPDWSIAEAARRIYGHVDGQVLSRVVLANPGQPDPRRVRPVEPLTFPALATEQTPLPGSRLVRVAREPDLNTALAAVRDGDDDGLSLRLCLHYHPAYGLACDVVVDETYADAATAHAALAALPPRAFQSAVLLDGFLPGTIFYSTLPLPRLCPAPVCPAGSTILARNAEGGPRDANACLP